MDTCLKIHPLNPDRWQDIETLFGPRGACGGCWCMFWRLSRQDFDRQKGDLNREAFQRLVQSGEIPGLLAYQDEIPIGWICVGPRERFPALARSKVLARVDDQSVWSVVCFFITKKSRKQGIASGLLEGAADFARQQGARILEGYPAPAKYGKLPDAFVYTGLESLFRAAGFTVAARRGKAGRGVWRKILT